MSLNIKYLYLTQIYNYIVIGGLFSTVVPNTRHSLCNCVGQPWLSMFLLHHLNTQIVLIIKFYLYTKYNNYTTMRYKDRFPPILGWPEVVISFSVTLSHSVPRNCTSCRGLALRIMECVVIEYTVYNYTVYTKNQFVTHSIRVLTLLNRSAFIYKYRAVFTHKSQITDPYNIHNPHALMKP